MPPSSSRVCSPSFGGSSRTPRRWPSSVIGNSVVFTVWPAASPSGSATSARPPVAIRCGSSYRSSGLRIGANGRPASRISAASSSARAVREALAQRRQQRGRAHARAGCWSRAPGRPSGRRSRARRRTCQPLRVADRGEEDLLAVLDGEHVVDRPRVDRAPASAPGACRSSRTAACAGPSGTRCSRTAPTAPPCRCR